MFFPQATENYNRKSVAGFSIDFAILNPSGYFFYMIYSMAGFLAPATSGTGEVRLDDLFFTIIAFTMSSI
jgi:hypothetical protein